MSAESSPAPMLVESAAVEASHTEAFGQLGDLELEFEKAEVDVLKYQIRTTAPLYERRNELTTQLPGFWVSVFGQSQDIDQHIAPDDMGAISTISSVNVIRPDVDEPRNFIIELGFDKDRNEWFEGNVLRKQFWWRTVEGVWSGLVSDPVEVRWKDGKDLSKGETGRVWEEWQAKKNGNGKGDEKGKGKGKGKGAVNGEEGKKAKKAKKLSLEERMAGGQPSFFTWFAWVGKGTDYGVDGEIEEEDDDEEKEDGDLFNHGDELALTIADDIYPNAIKYFLESLTGDDEEHDSDLSVTGDEDDDEEDEEEEDSEDDGVGSSRVIAKRADITADSEDEDEDEANRRRKRVKK
ncbi:hypothetical protein TWF730_004003 [Orbilia blumenaviensis]|uniref:Uncharacterized protein n=1 Tax=Orbilia blumenaviensis TaxID=1796055 RepID=A0AAV9U5J7_9PEZI